MQSVQSHSNILCFAEMPARVLHRRLSRRHTIRRGGRIFDKSLTLNHPYVVASGVIMILRDGQLVDLVEPGELLDQSIWVGATAVAHTDCTLAPQPIAA